jgi:hypothetical protein
MNERNETGYEIMKYTFYYCKRCGSTDISVSTVSVWDQINQQWVTEQPDLESGFCKQCEAATQINEAFIREKTGDNDAHC